MSHGVISGKAFRCRVFLPLLSAWLAWIILPAMCADARTVVEWDFSHRMHGWKGNHYVTDFVQSR